VGPWIIYAFPHPANFEDLPGWPAEYGVSADSIRFGTHKYDRGHFYPEVSFMGIMQEFMEFLKEYKVVGLAVAFIMGVAATTLVQSFAKNIVMPIIAPLMQGGDWQKAVLGLGPFQFTYGQFLADLINFIIIAFVVFMIAKIVLREEKVTKK
jgi:large conductance mechanosensitive channel